MAESGQYLRMVLQGAAYLLPSGASFAIEQRDALVLDDGPGPVAAWRPMRQTRWPAYGLDKMLQPTRPRDWQRAVFIEAAPHPVGLVVDEVQLLGRDEVHVVTAFTPLGAPPTRFGHLFNAAWVDNHRATLVLDPKILVAYLRSLDGAA